MKEKETDCPYGRCGCCRKCQPPCRQQEQQKKELVEKAYELTRDVQFSVSEIAKVLSRAKDGKDTCEDANWYSLHTSSAIGALIRMQSLIGDLREGGER